MIWQELVQTGNVKALAKTVFGLSPNEVLPFLKRLPVALGQQVLLACATHPDVDQWIGVLYPGFHRVGGQLVEQQQLPRLVGQLRHDWLRWMGSDIELGVFLGHVQMGKTLHHEGICRWLLEQMVDAIQSKPMDSQDTFQQHLKCHWMAHGWVVDYISILDPLLDAELIGLATLPSTDWLAKVMMQFPIQSMEGLCRHNHLRLEDGSVEERNRSLGLHKRWLELARTHESIKLILLMNGESFE